MIDTKEKNFTAYKNGLFGNKLRTWYGLDDFNNSNYTGYVTIRYSGDVGASNYTAYNVLRVNDKVKEFINNGADPKLLIINESAPDEKLLIQGEITKDINGYSLFYSLEKGKMRDCLQNGIQIYGLKVKLFLQNYLFTNSYNDIMELIDLYPDHIIEFSAYEMKLGDCRYRNTIIWEVRKY